MLSSQFDRKAKKEIELNENGKLKEDMIASTRLRILLHRQRCLEESRVNMTCQLNRAMWEEGGGTKEGEREERGNRGGRRGRGEPKSNRTREESPHTPKRLSFIGMG